MRKKRLTGKQTLVAWVLDETGSMESVKTQTVSGFNEFLETLKKKEGHFWIQLTRFNSMKINVRPPEDLKTASPLKDYDPVAATPLYDAVWEAIQAALAWQEGDGKRGIMLIVQTDGEENSSKTHSRAEVVEAIRKLREAGGEIMFLGVDIDLWQKEGLAQAAQVGTVSIPSANTQTAMRGLVGQTMSYMAGGAHEMAATMSSYAASVGGTVTSQKRKKT